jgi:hypothetical protein
MTYFPAQSSLMPIQIALSRFIEQGGDIFGNYPYWYLGTTPFHNLTGPFVPGILALIHKILPDFSLFMIMFGVIGIVWVIGGVGVYLFMEEMRVNKGELGLMRERIIALSATFFYLFGAIVPFLFRFTDGLYLIAFSFLPFVLLKYFKLLKKWTRKDAIITGLLISFVMLLNSLIIPALVIGMVSLLLAQGDWDHIETKIKTSCWLLVVSVLLATIWYTPGYWFTLLGAPSLAGEGLLKVIASLGKLIPVSLALAAAIFSIRLFKKREILRDFAFYWFFIFGFLSLLRFLSDPDFWLDWSAYGLEIQFGGAIILALMLGRFENRRLMTEDRLQKTDNRGLMTDDRRQMVEDRLPMTEDGKQKREDQFSVVGLQNQPSVFSLRSSAFSFRHRFSAFCLQFSFLIAYLLIFVFIFNKYVLGTLQKDITKSMEYKISKQIEQTAKTDDKVLLSGSTVFWLNAFVDIPQVRGGVDQASKDGSWRKEVWEIREGEDGQKSLEALKRLGVRYLVVHTSDSLEYYHDFKFPYKFENLNSLEKIYEEGGDIIYNIED